MMKMGKIYALAVCLFPVIFSYGQDAHFSQFNEQPALINPAFTGIDNPVRISAGFKDQWLGVTTPYRTYGISAETRLKPGNWEQVDKFRGMTFKKRSVGRLAGGLSIYKDKAGDGSLERTQANLSIASFIQTGSRSFISLGLQGSVAQQKLNNAALIFPDQYNGNGYDPNMASGETFGSQNFNYIDLGAGVLWSYNKNDRLASSNRVKANIGFSAYHLNKPKQKYLFATKDALSPKYVFYGDLLLRAHGSRVGFAPLCMVQLQGAMREITGGMLIKYYTNSSGSKYTGITKSSCISYGAYYRYKDALILNALLEWKEQYGVGLSYDINISKLSRASSGRGGLELMIRYTPPGAYLYQMKKAKNPQSKEN